MLALKTIKITPMFMNGTFGREFTAASYTSLTATNLKSKGSRSSLAKNNFITEPVIAPFLLTATRFNTGGSQPAQTSKPTGWPDKPAGWPDKDQLERYEKYFFRTIAFLIDITRLSLEWVLRNLDKYVAKNPSVQHYWQRLLQKIENSRK